MRTVRAVSLAAALACARVVGAQDAAPRIIEGYQWSDPEGRLMAYYAAALAFSPVGAPAALGAATPWSVVAGLELSYLPPLSEAQRTNGSQKTESTNLLSVLPRPRLALALPGGLALEASWVPPITVNGIRANLGAVAVSRSLATVRGVTLTPRLAVGGGRVTGPITCNEALERHGGTDAQYYELVCHGRASADHFSPSAASAELLASRDRGGVVVPYAGVGVRVEHTRFDVGVLFPDGTPDRAHPILDMHLTRPYAVAGATWRPMRRGALSGELFYAPGSLLTVRVQASLRVRGR